MSSDRRSDLVCLVRARLVRVLQMVPGDEFRGMIEFCGQKPQSFFIGTCVTSSVDKVEELAVTSSPINFRVSSLVDSNFCILYILLLCTPSHHAHHSFIFSRKSCEDVFMKLSYIH